MLIEQSEKQVLPDGVYFEQSTWYQVYTVETYLHFMFLAERNGDPLPAELHRRVERMIDFLAAICRPDGSLPQIGDADGGHLLPLARRAPADARRLFATAPLGLDRPHLALLSDGAAPPRLWL